MLIQKIMPSLLLLCSAHLFAGEFDLVEPEEQTRPFRFVLQGGVTDGGDKLSEVSVKNVNRHDSIYGGSLFQFGAGVLFQPKQLPLAIQATANFHTAGNRYENGHTIFARVPLELTLFYTGLKDWRFGAGVRHVRDPYLRLYHSDTGSSYDQEFANSTGALVEVGYGVSNKLWLSLRYVHERYTLKTVDGIDVSAANLRFDGSHAGVFAAYAF